MKPNFALSLAYEGAELLQRAANGWHSVGSVRFDQPDLDAALEALRERAKLLVGGGVVTTKLILPEGEIRFVAVLAPGPTDEARRYQIEAEIEGLTPYHFEDLAIDWAVDGDHAMVAIVARETIAEAESFALERGFNPVSFVAVPPPGQFGREPFFGASRAALSALGSGAAVQPDLEPVRVTGHAIMPKVAPSPARTPAPVAKPEAAKPEPAQPAAGQQAAKAQAPEPAAADVPPSPEATFSSRRNSPRGPTPSEAPPRPASAQPPAARAASAPAPAAPKPAAPLVPRLRGTARSALAATGLLVPVRRLLGRDANGAKRVAAPQGKAAVAAVSPSKAPTPPAAAQPTPQSASPKPALRPAAQAAPAPAAQALAAQAPAQAGQAPAGQAPSGQAPVTQAAAPRAPAPQSPPPAAAPKATPASARPASPQPAPPRPASARPAVPPLPARPTGQPARARMSDEDALTLFGRRGSQAEPSRSGRGLLFGGVAVVALLAAFGAWALFFNGSTPPVTPLAGGDPAPITAPEAVASNAAPVTTPEPVTNEPVVTEPVPDESVALTDPAAMEQALREQALETTETTPAADPSEEVAEAPEAAPEVIASPATTEATTEAPAEAPAAEAPSEIVAQTREEPAAAPGDEAEGAAEAIAGAAATEESTSPPEAPIRLALPGRLAVPELGEIVPAVPAPPPGFEELAAGLVPEVADTTAGALPLEVTEGRPSAVPAPRPAAIAALGSAAPEAAAPEATPAPDAAPDVAPAAEAAPEAPAPAGSAGVEIPDRPQIQLDIEPELSVSEGRPPVAPATRPASIAARAPEAGEAAAAEPVPNPAAAPGPAPAPRPADLSPPAAAPDEAPANLDQGSLAPELQAPGAIALTALRPQRRPTDLVPDASSAAETEEVSELAVARSLIPSARPSRVVERAETARAAAAAAAPAQTRVAAAAPAPAAAAAATGPRIPSSASVQQSATQSRAINTREANLIGVFGAPSNRRALVRMRNGDVVRLSVGDSFDGGRVSAIGESELRYVRSGRDRVLRIASRG